MRGDPDITIVLFILRCEFINDASKFLRCELIRVASRLLCMLRGFLSTKSILCSCSLSDRSISSCDAKLAMISKGFFLERKILQPLRAKEERGYLGAKGMFISSTFHSTG